MGLIMKTSSWVGRSKLVSARIVNNIFHWRFLLLCTKCSEERSTGGSLISSIYLLSVRLNIQWIHWSLVYWTLPHLLLRWCLDLLSFGFHLVLWLISNSGGYSFLFFFLWRSFRLLRREILPYFQLFSYFIQLTHITRPLSLIHCLRRCRGCLFKLILLNRTQLFILRPLRWNQWPHWSHTSSSRIQTVLLVCIMITSVELSQ